METHDEKADDQRLWRRLVLAHKEFAAARSALIERSSNRASVLTRALRTAQERWVALSLLASLPTEDRLEVFPVLVELASVAHSDIDAVRELVKSLPRSWVEAHIEEYANSILNLADDEEEYRRLAELYVELGLGPALERLAERALGSPNAGVVELGQYYASEGPELLKEARARRPQPR